MEPLRACSDEWTRRHPDIAAAWDDADLDRERAGLFSDTRATIEAAWVRRRDPWWPGFQVEGGKVLSAGLEAREPVRSLLGALDACYRLQRAQCEEGSA